MDQNLNQTPDQNKNSNKISRAKITAALIITCLVTIIIVGTLFLWLMKKQQTQFGAERINLFTRLDDLEKNKIESDNKISANECERLTGYTVMDYQNGWKEKFKKENNLSEAEFNSYITINNTSLQQTGNTCELAVRYIIKKDWLLVDRIDNMTLGVPPTISPSNLPLERDSEKPGRSGVSTIKLHDILSFKNKAEAFAYFIKTYNLSSDNVNVDVEADIDFQYFYNKESAESAGMIFAGEGGEPFIKISGVIDYDKNECLGGEVSLVTKETTYSKKPCIIN